MKIKCLVGCVLLAVLCSSCKKEIKAFLGDYSYKVSGQVCLITPQLLDESSYDTTYQVISHIGQMHIMPDNNLGGNNLLVTMSEMNGAANTIHATVKNDSIFFEPYEYSTTLSFASAIGSSATLTHVYQVKTAGKGIVNDNMIMMEQQWTGCRTEDSRATISGPKMTIVAEEN